MIIENDLSYKKIPIKIIFEYNVLFVNRFLIGFAAHCTTTLVLKYSKPGQENIVHYMNISVLIKLYRISVILWLSCHNVLYLMLFFPDFGQTRIFQPTLTRANVTALFLGLTQGKFQALIPAAITA